MYRTLLVDDREIYIIELKRLGVWGEKSGFELAGKAQDGARALEMLRQEHFDLVITDICMPKLDGIRLLQEIKKENLCPLVVLLSEHSDFEYARNGLQFGAFDYIVKPVQEQKVSEVLTRAAEQLKEMESKKQLEEAGSEGELFYPEAEEKSMLRNIGVLNEEIPEQFLNAAQTVCQIYGPGEPRAACVVRRLYLNIVSAIFEKYAWLPLYLDAGSFIKKTIDKDLTGYGEALAEALAFVKSLLPPGLQGVLQDICAFILENPEAEINLSSIADKFFINHTYLSNTFRQKTGIKFNDYVTSVRMSRAGYLLEHSQLKIYEISNALGYRDTDYFNRLFKKSTGKTPTDCRRAAETI